MTDEAEPKGPGGRPTSYRPEYAAQAEKLCRLGATDIELADFFEVATSTIWRWSQAHEEFCSALKAGKEASDARVERSLYAKATGYTHDVVKIFQYEGQPVIVPYREHVAPDTTAAIFWLKNRKPKEWRDRIDLSATIQKDAAELSDAELAAIVAGRRGAGASPPSEDED